MKHQSFSPTIVVLATAALFVCAVAQASASSRHLDVLGAIPCDALRMASGSPPDEEGLVGHNRGGYRSPTFQRGAARLLILGVVCGNRQYIDDAFRAIDVVFEHQGKPGHFGGDKSPSGVAFWLCELNQALLVLNESTFGAAYQTRVQELVPKIHLAATWLAMPVNQDQLKKVDRRAPNRLFFDALAYGTSSLLCDDATLVHLGRSFVDSALLLYRDEDGVFLENGGHDSSYQAVSAWLLQVWVLHFPDPALDDIADKAAKWVVSRIQSDGSVDVTGNTRTGLGQETWQGSDKDVNYPEVLRCLLYYVARRGDPKAEAAAKRLMAWMRGQK